MVVNVYNDAVYYNMNVLYPHNYING